MTSQATTPRRHDTRNRLPADLVEAGRTWASSRRIAHALVRMVAPRWSPDDYIAAVARTVTVAAIRTAHVTASNDLTPWLTAVIATGDVQAATRYALDHNLRGRPAADTLGRAWATIAASWDARLIRHAAQIAAWSLEPSTPPPSIATHVWFQATCAAGLQHHDTASPFDHVRLDHGTWVACGAPHVPGRGR